MHLPILGSHPVYPHTFAYGLDIFGHPESPVLRVELSVGFDVGGIGERVEVVEAGVYGSWGVGYGGLEGHFVEGWLGEE